MVEGHSRRDVAVQQLETALRLYFEGRDFYSVITLAGAADTILAQMLRIEGKEPRLEELKKATVEIARSLLGQEVSPKWVADRANLARNALKHWDPDQPVRVSFDAKEEATDMLDRAVTNYWSLVGEVTPEMQRFMTAWLSSRAQES
jgi:hypothetical protein